MPAKKVKTPTRLAKKISTPPTSSQFTQIAKAKAATVVTPNSVTKRN